jgi:hypothetical protein
LTQTLFRTIADLARAGRHEQAVEAADDVAALDALDAAWHRAAAELRSLSHG